MGWPPGQVSQGTNDRGPTCPLNRGGYWRLEGLEGTLSGASPSPSPNPSLAHNCTALGRSQKAFTSPSAGREVILSRRELEPQSRDLAKMARLVSGGPGTETQELQPSSILNCTILGATCHPFGLFLVIGWQFVL